MTMTSRQMRRFAASLLLAGAVALGGCAGSGAKNKTPTVGKRTPILSRIESGATVDPALESVAVIVPPPSANAEWAQAGGNAAKSIGHLALSATPREVWTADIAGSSNSRRLASSPVVADGMLFVVDTAGAVHAFDAASGSKRWSHTIEVSSELRSAVFGGGVSYADGRVYVTNGVGDIAALDAKTGEQVWKVRPAGPLRGAPTIAFNEAFVMTQNNQIYALSLENGEVEWQEASSLGQTGVFGVAAPAAGQGTVIAGYSTGELTAYRYENGRNVWADALARTSIATEVGVLTDVDADPIIDNGRVYALGQGGRMAAYELVTGQRVWELSLAGISTPAIAGEWIFTLTDDARLLCIQRNTGKVRWISQLQRYKDEKGRKGQIFWTGPVLAGNNLWIASSRGEIYRADVMSGVATEYQKLNSAVSLAPIVANETLYVLDDGGRIHAYR